MKNTHAQVPTSRLAADELRVWTDSDMFGSLKCSESSFEKDPYIHSAKTPALQMTLPYTYCHRGAPHVDTWGTSRDIIEYLDLSNEN